MKKIARSLEKYCYAITPVLCIADLGCAAIGIPVLRGITSPLFVLLVIMVGITYKSPSLIQKVLVSAISGGLALVSSLIILFNCGGKEIFGGLLLSSIILSIFAVVLISTALLIPGLKDPVSS